MKSSSVKKEHKVGASSAPRENDESHRDDITAVDKGRGFGAAGSERACVCSEPQSWGTSGAFSDQYPPQTTVECKPSNIYDMFGLCGIPSPTNALQWLKHAFLACIDSTSLCANDRHGPAAPEVLRSESLEGRQANSTNSSRPLFSDSRELKQTNVFDASTSNTNAILVSRDEKLKSNCTESYCIESNEVPANEGSTDSQSPLGTGSDTPHLHQIHSQVDSEGSSVDSDNENASVNRYDVSLEHVLFESELADELAYEEFMSSIREIEELVLRHMHERGAFSRRSTEAYERTIASTSLYQTSKDTMGSQSTTSEEEEEEEEEEDEEEMEKLVKKMERQMNKYRKKERRKKERRKKERRKKERMVKKMTLEQAPN